MQDFSDVRASRPLLDRLAAARPFLIHPLSGDITTVGGERHILPAINEISLLRETRQAAKLEVLINEKTMLEELACDGVLVSTPAGSTAYNLSANGPILPLESQMLALTPISPFRPRRWKGAILPDRMKIVLRVLDREKSIVNLDRMNLSKETMSKLDVMLSRPEGILVVNLSKVA